MHSYDRQNPHSSCQRNEITFLQTPRQIQPSCPPTIYRMLLVVLGVLGLSHRGRECLVADVWSFSLLQHQRRWLRLLVERGVSLSSILNVVVGVGSVSELTINGVVVAGNHGSTGTSNTSLSFSGDAVLLHYRQTRCLVPLSKVDILVRTYMRSMIYSSELVKVLQQGWAYRIEPH